MAVPKKKVSRRRRGNRRRHQVLSLPNLAPCPRCGRSRLPHRACVHCGFYKGKEAIVPKE